MSRIHDALQWLDTLKEVLKSFHNLPAAWASCQRRANNSCRCRTRSSRCSRCAADGIQQFKILEPELLMQKLHADLEAAAALPLKDWRKLVLKEQCPARLAAASCTILDTCGNLGRKLTTSVWVVLLKAVFNSKALTHTDTTDARSSIVESIAQQLQQAGLLTQLPGLLIHTAQLLQSSACDVLSVSQLLHVDSAQLDWNPIDDALPLPVLVSHANMLIVLQLCLVGLWHNYSFITGPEGTPRVTACMQLELAAIQCVSRCADLLPAGTPPPLSLHRLLVAALNSSSRILLRDWLRPASSDEQQTGLQLEGALLAVGTSPYPVQSMLAHMLISMRKQNLLQQTQSDSSAAAVHQGNSRAHNSSSSSNRSPGAALPASDTPAAAAGSSNGRAGAPSASSKGANSSSSSSSCSAGTHSSSDAGGAEWQQACAALTRVPGSLSRLSSSLGISDRTALWAAALATKPDPVLTTPALCDMMFKKFPRRTISEQAGRVLLLVAAWLDVLKQLPPASLTERHVAVLLFVRNVEKVLFQLAWKIRVTKPNGAGQKAAGSTQQQDQPSPPEHIQQLLSGQPASTALVAAAALDILVVLPPQLRQVLDHLELLLQQQQRQQQPVLAQQQQQTAAAAAALHDHIGAIGRILWVVTNCCVPQLRQHPADQGTADWVSMIGSQHANPTGLPSLHQSTAAADLSAAAAASEQPDAQQQQQQQQDVLQQQTQQDLLHLQQSVLQQQLVQLLGLWEAYIRFRAATGAAAADQSLTFPINELAKLLLFGKLATEYSPVVGVVLQGSAPGRPEQLQLFHLLCSLLKLGRMSSWLDQRLFWALKPAHQALMHLIAAAGRSVQAARCPSGVCTAAGDVVGAANSGAHAAAAAAVTGAEPDSADATSSDHFWSEGAVTAAVLWLRVLGLCCLQLAAQLADVQQAASVAALTADAGEEPEAQQADTTQAWAGVDAPCLGAYSHALVVAWHALQDEALAACLIAQGYDTQGIVSRVGDAKSALDAMPTTVEDQTAFCKAAADCLESAGLALTSLATPYACNSPTCSNVSGPSELLLVNGRSCVCGGCRVAHYCSRACQRQHWKQHKPVCQALEAASAAAAPVSTAAASAASAEAALPAPAAAGQS